MLLLHRKLFWTTFVILVEAHFILGNITPSDEEKFKEYKIIPDLLSKPPEQLVNVKYGNSFANLGNELTPTITRKPPLMSWKADNNTFYTILMTDPDLRPTFDQYVHWMVVNIPGNEVMKGNTIFHYIGAAPQQTQGLHRYVIQVFKQPKKLPQEVTDAVMDKTLADRGTISIPKFVLDNLLISPIAANFYRAAYDYSVPKIYAEISEFYKIN